MPKEIILPRVDMDMAEGKIAYWYVKNGDQVKKGQTLFDIETDKATMEVDAEADGVVAGIDERIGEPLPVGSVVGWLLAEGEVVPSGETVAPLADEVVVADPVQVAEPEEEVAPIAHATHGHVLATPLARRLAQEAGVNLVALSLDARRPIFAEDVREASKGQARQAADAPLSWQWLSREAGVPIVALHGFGADAGSWRPLAGILGGVPFLAIDLPCHGKSGEYQIQDLNQVVELVIATLDHAGVEACHLLGHSLGGAVATAVAARLHARVKTLMLLAPAGMGPEINGEFIEGLCRAEAEGAMRSWLCELVVDRRLISGSFVATALQQFAQPGRRASLRQLATALMPHGTQVSHVLPELEYLDFPVKVIWGAADKVLPVRHAEGLPGNVARHIIKNVGHLPQLEAAELVSVLLKQHLKGA